MLCWATRQQHQISGCCGSRKTIQMHNPLPALLRVEQAASRLNLTRQDVTDLIRTGNLPAQRIGTRVYRVSETDIQRFLASQSAELSPVVSTQSGCENYLQADATSAGDADTENRPSGTPYRKGTRKKYVTRPQVTETMASDIAMPIPAGTRSCERAPSRRDSRCRCAYGRVPNLGMVGRCARSGSPSHLPEL